MLTLMSLIAGISAALFANTLSNTKQRAAAGEIVSTLRYAKHLAAARNEKQTVVFDLDAGNYGIAGRPAKEIPEKIRLEIYENGVNAELVVKGRCGISYDAAGSVSWSGIKILRGNRVILIKPDPIQTAIIAGDDAGDENE